MSFFSTTPQILSLAVDQKLKVEQRKMIIMKYICIKNTCACYKISTETCDIGTKQKTYTCVPQFNMFLWLRI